METKCNFCSTEITGPSHHCPGLGKIVYQDGHLPTEHQTEEQTTPDDKPKTEEPTTNTNWFSKIFKRN